MQSSGRVNKVHDSRRRFEHYEEVEKKHDRWNHRKAVGMKREQQLASWEDDYDYFTEEDNFSQ